MSPVLHFDIDYRQLYIWICPDRSINSPNRRIMDSFKYLYMTTKKTTGEIEKIKFKEKINLSGK